MILYCILLFRLFSYLVNFVYRRFPGTWKFKFPKTSFRFVIRHKKILINKKRVTLRKSTNKRFPGWFTFPYRGVTYFTRFTSRGIKIVSVKGKKVITSKVVSRPKKGKKTPTKGKKKPTTGKKQPKTGKNPKTGEKKPTTGEKKPKKGKKHPTTGKKQPKTGKKPKKGEKKPTTGEKKPKKGKKHPTTGEKQPKKGKKQPKKGKKTPSEKRPGKPRKRKRLKIHFLDTNFNLYFYVKTLIFILS